MEGTGLTDRDKDIKRVILQYKHKLCQRLIATDMLRESPTLKSHLGSEVVEKIERVEDIHGMTSAAYAFLSHMEKSISTGIWSSFYDHLRNNGYLRILQIVDGYMTDDDFEVDEQHMTGLDHIHSPLSVKDLIGHLLQKGVLLPIHYEKILAKSDVPSDATKLMFEFLKRSKSIEWFELFLEVVGLWDKEKANEIREFVKFGDFDNESLPGIKDSSEAGNSTKLTYDRDFLLKCRSSPLVVPPENLPPIPGITYAIDLGWEKWKESGQESCTVIRKTDSGFSNNLNSDVKSLGEKTFDDEKTMERNVQFFEPGEKGDSSGMDLDTTKAKQLDSDTDFSNLRDSPVEEMSLEEETAELKLRGYQKELAADGLAGKNCMVVAPTGSGKTHVALSIIQNHFQSASNVIKKAVFLVNNVALASQQCKMIQKYIPELKLKELCGSASDMLDLWLMLDHYNMFVMTAQILLDALNKKDDQPISKFTLLVFDECHHTTKNHPYAKIMGIYVDQKLQDMPPSLPQIIGLTASVGVGKAKDNPQAVKHILQLCANLDAEKICTVKDNIDELTEYSSVPTQETVEVVERPIDIFGDVVKREITKIEQIIKEKQESCNLPSEFPSMKTPPFDKGSQPYGNWITTNKKAFNEAINEASLLRYFNSCFLFLEMYSAALSINSCARTVDALEFLNKKVKNRDKTKFVELDKKLTRSYKDNVRKLKDSCDQREFINPKLEKLKSMILKKYEESPDFRTIVFVKTKDLVMSLVNWAMDCPELTRLNPSKLVGQSSQDLGGMTQNQQVDVLGYFKDGNHQLLFATSVAEEGLDVRKCQQVIRYLYVTTEIAMMQARGRARADDSEYYLVAEKGKGTADKEQLNIIRELMMKSAIEEIQAKPQGLPALTRKIQEEDKRDRECSVLQIAERRMAEGEFKLLCGHCSCLVCFTSDIRKIENNHHVVIRVDFKNYCKVNPMPITDKYTVSKRGKAYCAKCGHDWGIVAQYKGRYFYVIKIKSFVVSDFDDRKSTFKQWKQIPFPVNEIQEQDSDKIENNNRALAQVLSRLE